MPMSHCSSVSVEQIRLRYCAGNIQHGVDPPKRGRRFAARRVARIPVSRGQPARPDTQRPLNAPSSPFLRAATRCAPPVRATRSREASRHGRRTTDSSTGASNNRYTLIHAAPRNWRMEFAMGPSVCFQRKVSRVEELHFRIRIIALVCLGTGRQGRTDRYGPTPRAASAASLGSTAGISDTARCCSR